MTVCEKRRGRVRLPHPFPDTERGRAVYDSYCRSTAPKDGDVLEYLYPGDVVEYVAWSDRDMSNWSLTQKVIEEECVLRVRRSASLGRMVGHDGPAISDLSIFAPWGVSSRMNTWEVRSVRVVRQLAPSV